MKVRELIQGLRILDPDAEVEVFSREQSSFSSGIDRIGVAYLTEEGTFELDDIPDGLGATATPIVCIWPKTEDLQAWDDACDEMRYLLDVVTAAVNLCTGSMVPEEWIANKVALERAVERLGPLRDYVSIASAALYEYLEPGRE